MFIFGSHFCRHLRSLFLNLCLDKILNKIFLVYETIVIIIIIIWESPRVHDTSLSWRLKKIKWSQSFNIMMIMNVIWIFMVVIYWKYKTKHYLLTDDDDDDDQFKVNNDNETIMKIKNQFRNISINQSMKQQNMKP
mgnify:CR=1 FL=1